MAKFKRTIENEKRPAWLTKELIESMAHHYSSHLNLYSEMFDFSVMEDDRVKEMYVMLKGENEPRRIVIDDIITWDGASIRYRFCSPIMKERNQYAERIISVMNILYVEYIYDE